MKRHDWDAEALYGERIESVLKALLLRVPFLSGFELEWEVALPSGARADAVVALRSGGEVLRLVCEVKRNLQPRQVMEAVRQVKGYCLALPGESVYPVVVSDYISPRSAQMLAGQEVSYFDFTGHCRFAFDGVYIEIGGEPRREVARRGIKSLFGAKSSRMLRVMLNRPLRPWLVKALAAEAALSLGQVSNVRRALLEQQFAVESGEGGIRISDPSGLLNEWRSVYRKNTTGKAAGYYSLLNADERLAAIKEAMAEAKKEKAGIVLCGLSAARWLAPYAKTVSERFYADKRGMAILKRHLMLEAATVGPNVLIEEPKDPFLFAEAQACAKGLLCTSAVQTYLDLCVAGEREREAADHLAAEVLQKIWRSDEKEGG